MCFVSSEWPPQSHQLTLKSTFLPNFNIFLKNHVSMNLTDRQPDRCLWPRLCLRVWVWADSYILFIYIGFDSIVPERWNSRQKKKKSPHWPQLLKHNCCEQEEAEETRMSILTFWSSESFLPHSRGTLTRIQQTNKAVFAI